MLSILIPVYNYDVNGLVNELHRQVSNESIDFEIICLDDKSDTSFIEANKSIESLSDTRLTLATTNKGIAGTRQDLVNLAKYDWVLLVDADTKPKSKDYIKDYLDYVNTGHEAIFGGFAYNEEPPEAEKLLRWKYGRKYEAISAADRNSKPFKVTIAANLLIKKHIYKNLHLDQPGNYYGMDLLFGPKLQADITKVLHIDNQVYHLGLESSESYLKKTEKAVETLWNLHSSNQLEQHQNTLLSTFLKVKKYGLRKLLSTTFKVLKNSITRNLTGKNPSTTLFQFYKLMYLCQLSKVYKD
ncbi:MAG: glycosyltransferase family 2 protein [Bacteroidia bacterium]|nr:glycosyltransferase family 2 protein [Bacteroidia bacterium]NNK27649.1 glycosyltransferase family 2 protein [Flavobacteriaceae bacterium]